MKHENSVIVYVKDSWLKTNIPVANAKSRNKEPLLEENVGNTLSYKEMKVNDKKKD